MEPHNADVEPGLESAKARPHPGKASWLKVAAMAMIVAMIALFFIGSQSSSWDPENVIRSTTEPLEQNSTAEDSHPAQTHTYAPEKRDPWWEQKVDKGHWLACMMNMLPARVTPQAPWTQHADLQAQGWDGFSWPYDNQAHFETNSYVPALRAMGQHFSDYSRWLRVDNEHDETEAQYQNTFNIEDGFIVADFNYGPDYNIAEYGLDVDAPELKKWSDVVFLNYQDLHDRAGSSDQEQKKVEHFIRYNIKNPDALKTIRAAMNNGDPNGPIVYPPAWPGWEWKIWQDGAKACLSTPNGVGVAYFLAQHKEYLGVRSIDSVRAFDCSNSERQFAACLYFHIVEGPINIDTI